MKLERKLQFQTRLCVLKNWILSYISYNSSGKQNFLLTDKTSKAPGAPRNLEELGIWEFKKGGEQMINRTRFLVY